MIPMMMASSDTEVAIEGEMYMWGMNTQGQLGLGDSGSSTHRSTPVQLGSDTNWVTWVMSGRSGHAIKSDGTLWSWGRSNYGQGGFGNTTDTSSPVQLGALTTWAHIGANLYSHHGILTNGKLYSWGAHASKGGNLLETEADVSSPVQVGSLTNWVSLAGNTLTNYGTASIKSGKLYTWGGNALGSLGLGNTTNFSSPQQVGSLTDWAQVSGHRRAFAAVKTDGTLWSWGSGYRGQTGQGNTTDISSPVQIGSLTNWLQVSLGGIFGSALKTDGTIWTWGAGQTGRLGHGNTTDISSPVQVGSLTDWESISANYRGWHARKTDGTLWGNGAQAPGLPTLGHGTINVSSPIQIGVATNWQTFKKAAGYTGARYSIGFIKDA